MKALILFIILPFCLISQQFGGEKYKHIYKVEPNEKAATCTPPSHSTFLETNNVRAMIHTAGNLWQVPNQNFSQYEVPKNSGIMAVFTSALWLGGVDVNGQLKLAALRYREGQDYWTGPLSINSALTEYDNCAKYDKHFISKQDEIRGFDDWFQLGINDANNGTNTQSKLYPNYKIPQIIKDWPAHGDVSQGQDYYLAPFYDRDENGVYEWENGDYPWYDFKKEKACKSDRKVSLYGDENFWWVMNDKGNIHTETGADPIGMEIRAQAFAFATNDEINNMTFYNYELINRGTQTLYDTYFGLFVDGALGDPYDDYVGCDVNRGLAYDYNGDNYDGDNFGFKGYGFTPPAVGVDFFEGPFQDNDGIDNAFGINENEALNGIGYGDGIIDNERFGMRRFLYYNNTGNGGNINQTDPIKAPDYYNYLRGFWKDGTPFYYGGNGHISDPSADPNVQCDFLFPGDTDPLGWGTNGIAQPEWTEANSGNEPYDRRSLQSAGPFILKPGAVNNITIGIVWARANTGGALASIENLKVADDKAQALFENCFKVLDAPHAPNLDFQELSNEVILTLSNSSNSNNYNEQYEEFDPFIASNDETVDKNYRFQGYLIYQLKDASISISDLEDVTKSRLVAQCDLKDTISSLINFEFDESLGASIPVKKVDAENKGIKHSFLVNEDLFAQGNRKLVNFKRYYYMAISYAHNNYKTYNPNDPSALDGQKKLFLSSRKAAIGEVKSIEVIPHNPMPEAGGTLHYLEYGETPEISRLDGRGNGNRVIDLLESSIDFIVNNGYLDKHTYQKGKGPINVKVIDPLNVVSGYFECKFTNYQSAISTTNEFENKNYEGTDTASWVIYRYDKENGDLLDSVNSDRIISNLNEQIIPEWGVSIEIYQEEYYFVGSGGSGSGPEQERYTSPIESTVSFSDSSKPWLGFIADQDGFYPTNWILSGDYKPGDDTIGLPKDIFYPGFYADELGRDKDKSFAKLINAGISPYRLTAYLSDFHPLAYPSAFTGIASSRKNNSISRAPSIDLILTSDKSKWTRCAVIELGRYEELNVGGAEPGTLRKSFSVNKEGQNDGSGTKGMGWFPGYAIDVETGVRLHIAFGENSFLGAENGSDMKWNPTSRITDNVGNPLFGGQHVIYIFGYNISGNPDNTRNCPEYDGGNNWVYDKFFTATNTSYTDIFNNMSWVANPILQENQSLLSTDVKIRVRINKEYNDFVATNKNNGRPMYSWSMDNLSTVTNNSDRLKEALELINVVPNPYYAFSEYEESRVDTRVKITNLPEKCTIKIYNISGKLIKTFKKSNPTTFQDWKLVNEVGINVASGIYLIHVEVPEVGERIIKSFIGVRSPDFEGF